MRKLPDKETVNRLYWLEEWTTRQIAEHYQCSAQTVSQFMVQHHIPTRKRGYQRKAGATCIEPGCKKLTVRVKRWFKNGPTYNYTSRCAEHYHASVRATKRAYARKAKGYIRQYKPDRRERVPLGELGTIVVER